MSVLYVCKAIGDLYTKLDYFVSCLVGRNITLTKRTDLSDEMLCYIGQHSPQILRLLQCTGSTVTERGLRDLFKGCKDSLKVIKQIFQPSQQMNTLYNNVTMSYLYLSGKISELNSHHNKTVIVLLCNMFVHAYTLC